MERPPRRSLSFVGAGALGQTFAGLVAASGCEVTLLATPGSAARLLAAGTIRLRGAVEKDVPVGPAPAPPGRVGVTAKPRDLPPETGLIFATKGHQLPAAIESVRAAWPAANDSVSWVAGVQNGLVKDDLLAAAFGTERVVGAATILGGQRTSEGPDRDAIAVMSMGATYLGEFSAGISPRVSDAVAILRGAGIPTDAVGDVRSVLWSKALNAVGVFGVCVPTRSSSPAMTRSPDLVRAYLDLIREAGAVARANGVELGDYVGFPIRTYLDTPQEEVLARFAANAGRLPPPGSGKESFPSMVQDLLADRPLEVDAIFGDMVDRAARVGTPVPRITLVRDLIRGIDPGGK
jgi:2-dehydropantoate 2-reductase